SPSGKTHNVPGFFDADGDPANTSATTGNKWKARFAAGEEGEWRYSVSFVTGENVAANLTGGTRGIRPDGETGAFQIGPQNKTGKDFRAKGKLQYVGKRYLQFADGDYFIKLGANSPEVLLEYGEFDGTPGHDNDIYAPNLPDWNERDPTWGNGKGKGIIGLVNYLSSLGVNSHYFLCMNAYGDGREAWPWTSEDAIDVYDVSKLAQWEILFTHFDKMGLMVHFQLSESENTNYFEAKDGQETFSNARKIFYRELVARFGHHMAITWNIGEENQAEGTGFQKPNTHSQRKSFATRIRALAPYQDHISIHNGPAGRFDDILPQLIGFEDITGPSLQTFLIAPNKARQSASRLNNHDEVARWVEASEGSGHPWVVSVDEPWWGREPKSLADTVRKEAVWGVILAGGHMEFYTGRDDVRHIDYRKYEDCWKAMGNASTFLNQHLADIIADMRPDDDVVSGDGNWAMVKEGQAYLFYLNGDGNAVADLTHATDQTYDVRWLNPRTGREFLEDRHMTVPRESKHVSLGKPPNSTTDDWVLLLRNTATVSQQITAN
ncbi:MAG: DUF5060 domain-containing protein, partial [Rhodopirellula sp. JB044]|uniref:DUF5060 domain-containing protein n=1 Tax=Rhodopirellula sp. JB044 TaxID=3342844 RepID=UPI00370C7601